MLPDRDALAIEEIIGYTFRDKSLLCTCFTHSSYANAHKTQSNERLEFLGDAVLGFLVAKALYALDGEDEGRMTERRQKFVSEEPLKECVERAGLDKFLLCTGGMVPSAKAVSSLQSQTTSNATTFAQFGALEALKNPEAAKESLDAMLKVFDKRRLMLWEGLNSIKGIACRRARGAFYLFPNISSFGLSSTDFCSALLEDELVAVVPGIAFGSDSNVRFSYAVSDSVIAKGLERLDRFCTKLGGK